MHFIYESYTDVCKQCPVFFTIYIHSMIFLVFIRILHIKPYTTNRVTSFKHPQCVGYFRLCFLHRHCIAIYIYSIWNTKPFTFIHVLYSLLIILICIIIAISNTYYHTLYVFLCTIPVNKAIMSTYINNNSHSCIIHCNRHYTAKYNHKKHF